MFDKCIRCERLGQDCVPNFMALPFPDLLNWWKQRQTYLGWSNQVLSDRSTIPIGTINRIKAGEDDCRYSTMRMILHALMGGYSVEFPCQKKLDQEFANIDILKAQCEDLSNRNEELETKLRTINEEHRSYMMAFNEQYRNDIAWHKEVNDFLREQLKAWQHEHTSKG